MSIEKIQKNEASEIISRMKEALGVSSDAALCRKLGSKSTGLVGNWRKTGTVPDGAVAKASQISGRSVEWFRSGKEGAVEPEPEGREIYRHIAEMVREATADWPGWRGVELTPQEVERELLIRSLPQEKQQAVDNILNAFLIEEKAKRQGSE